MSWNCTGPVHVYSQSGRCWTAIVMVSMLTGLHCLMVGMMVYWHGAIVKFERPGRTTVYNSGVMSRVGVEEL